MTIQSHYTSKVFIPNCVYFRGSDFLKERHPFHSLVSQPEKDCVKKVQDFKFINQIVKDRINLYHTGTEDSNPHTTRLLNGQSSGKTQNNMYSYSFLAYFNI
jgi:hypothetical protein